MRRWRQISKRLPTILQKKANTESASHTVDISFTFFRTPTDFREISIIDLGSPVLAFGKHWLKTWKYVFRVGTRKANSGRKELAYNNRRVSLCTWAQVLLVRRLTAILSHIPHLRTRGTVKDLRTVTLHWAMNKLSLLLNNIYQQNLG